MAQLAGTNLQAAVVPNDSNDVFATHLAKYGQGGLRTVATLAERDAITLERREAGMEVKVIADGKTYALDLAAQNLADNANWHEAAGGAVDTSNLAKLDAQRNDFTGVQLVINSATSAFTEITPTSIGASSQDGTSNLTAGGFSFNGSAGGGSLYRSAEAVVTLNSASEYGTVEIKLNSQTQTVDVTGAAHLKGPTPTEADDLATKGYVDAHAGGSGGSYVNLTGAQAVAGEKTWTNAQFTQTEYGQTTDYGGQLQVFSPDNKASVSVNAHNGGAYLTFISPSGSGSFVMGNDGVLHAPEGIQGADPTQPGGLATKAYVDAHAGGGVDATAVHKTGNESIAGLKTFTDDLRVDYGKALKVGDSGGTYVTTLRGDSQVFTIHGEQDANGDEAYVVGFDQLSLRLPRYNYGVEWLGNASNSDVLGSNNPIKMTVGLVNGTPTLYLNGVAVGGGGSPVSDFYLQGTAFFIKLADGQQFAADLLPLLTSFPPQVALSGTSRVAPIYGSLDFNENGALSFYDQTNDWYVKLSVAEGLNILTQDADGNGISNTTINTDGIAIGGLGSNLTLKSPSGTTQVALSASDNGTLLVNGAEISGGGGGSTPTIDDSNYGKLNQINTWNGANNFHGNFRTGSADDNKYVRNDSNDTMLFYDANNGTQKGTTVGANYFRFFYGGGQSYTATYNPSTNSLDFTGGIKATKFIGDGSGLTNLPTGGAVTLPPMIIDLVGYQYNPIPTTAVNTGQASSIVVGSNFRWDAGYAAGKTVVMEICCSATAGKTLAASLYTLDGVNVNNSGISGFSSDVGLARTGTFTLVDGTTYQVRIAVGSSGTGYLYSARLIIK